ncbi:CcmD family protein [Solitalea koreensis]|uniref:CcmD family protein n=1 Tax=Solitalea koreensis TaxID=543615 RepID=A0A521D2D6_9SPHI|nr:CcmD family protein [Solitalea koreensis]SMO65853.1 CcmD family protein [Solitalea koreensis]
MKKYALTLILSLISLFTFAQTTTNGIEMADTMRSSGKIYVVVGVMAIIFVGIAIYLFSIDRKLTKLENEQQHLKK